MKWRAFIGNPPLLAQKAREKWGTQILGHAASCQAFEEAFPQNAQLFPRAQRDLRGEDIVLFHRNLLEQAAVDVDQNPECGLAVFSDICDQFVAANVKLAGALRFERQY